MYLPLQFALPWFIGATRAFKLIDSVTRWFRKASPSRAAGDFTDSAWLAFVQYNVHTVLVSESEYSKSLPLEDLATAPPCLPLLALRFRCLLCHSARTSKQA